MSESIKGTAHLFGTDGQVITNLTITSIDLTEVFGLNQTTPDEDGVTIETRRDDKRYTGSIVAFMRNSYAMPNVGATLALNGFTSNALTKFERNYEVIETPVAMAAGDKIRVTLQLESYPGTNI